MVLQAYVWSPLSFTYSTNRNPLSKCLNNQFIGETKSKTEKAFPELSAENFTAFPDSQEFWNFYQLFLDFKLELQKNGSNLGKFWLSFIKLVEIFWTFSIWHEQGNGTCIWCHVFPYNNLNYATYMTAMLGKMLNLEQNHPNIYQKFEAGYLCSTFTTFF